LDRDSCSYDQSVTLTSSPLRWMFQGRLGTTLLVGFQLEVESAAT
jgi:hypothetical protein